MRLEIMVKRWGVLGLFTTFVIYTDAQINYGTTGLMNMPTADMQRDKTFMGKQSKIGS